MLLFLRILSLYLIKNVDRPAIECNMNMNDFPAVARMKTKTEAWLTRIL